MAPQEQQQRLMYSIAADAAARDTHTIRETRSWHRGEGPDIRTLQHLQQLITAARAVQDLMLLAYDDWDKAERPTREEVAAALGLKSRQALRKRYEKASKHSGRAPDWVPRTFDTDPLPIAAVLRDTAGMLLEMRRAILDDKEADLRDGDNDLTARMKRNADVLRSASSHHHGADTEKPHVIRYTSDGDYQLMLDEFRRARRHAASPNYLGELAQNYARQMTAFNATLDEAKRTGPQLGHDVAAAKTSEQILGLREDIEKGGGRISGTSVFGPDGTVLANWSDDT